MLSVLMVDFTFENWCRFSSLGYRGDDLSMQSINM